MTENTGKMKINDVARAVAQNARENMEAIQRVQANITGTLDAMRKKEAELLRAAREKQEAAQQAKVAEEARVSAAPVAPDVSEKPPAPEQQTKKMQTEAETAKAETVKPTVVAQEPPKPAPQQPAKPAFERPAERLARQQGRVLRDDAAIRNAQRAAANQQQAQQSRPQRPNNQNNTRGYQRDSNAPRQQGQGNRSPRSGNGQQRDSRPNNRSANSNWIASALSSTPTVQEKGRVSNYDPNRANYVRVFDEKKTKNRKALDRERRAMTGVVDDEVVRGRKPKRKNTVQQRPEAIVIEKAVITGDTVTIKTLAEKIGKPAAEIIKKLMMIGVIATINNEIDFDTASLIASELGVELEQRFEQTAEDVLIAQDVEDDEGELVKRPPVVTIMGHVDHGKTSLLDAIRSSRVTANEAGGITQHIGAYEVQVNGESITFLDTPGHEAFTSMRARGAQVTDVVVLVVAADDGIMPQTQEAINHAKAAGVPIIVAINKIDKPAANPERVKQELTEYGLVWEEWGGDTVIVPVSAVTQEGLDSLLEMILLVSEVQDLKANPNRMAKGAIIEAKLDKTRGPLATVLVQNGTLRVGQTVVAGTASGRIKAMTNDRGEKVEFALPSQPVEILGFGFVPDAGDILYAVEADKLSRQVVEERKNKIKAEQLKKSIAKVSLDELFEQISEGQIKDLNVIVKADVQGSVEAVKQSLEKLSNDKVRVKCIHGGVGGVSETDVMLASASNAIIIGFNVRPESAARVLSEREGVDLRLYRVIYDAIEDIEKAMKGMLEPVFREVVLGKAEVRETFKVSGVGTIAGCYVQEGKIVRSSNVRVIRDSVVIFEGKLASLKRFKDDVREVLTGYECGLSVQGYNDIKKGDILESYTEEEVEQ